MRIVMAPDSYKDALSAPQAAAAMARGVRQVFPQADIVECPLGDGGEGTLESILSAQAATLIRKTVKDALGRSIEARWALIEHSQGKSAIVELAEAAGLQALTMTERDARITSTYGVGELITDALDHGIEYLLLTLGGSATNDGGAGMLQALGARLLDSEGNELPPGGAALNRLAHIDLGQLDSRLNSIKVEAAVDVSNPLVGIRGASAIFGPQKGASSDDVQLLDKALQHYADITAQLLGTDYKEVPGAGAAGGMGFAAKAFLGAELRPGIELVMEQLGFRSILTGADLLFVGEGSLDHQSLNGKTPVGAARVAKQLGIPCIALVGSLGSGWQSAHDEGISAAFALAEGPATLEAVLPHTARQLEARTAEIMRIWKAANH